MQIYSHDVFKFACNLDSQLNILSFITNKNALNRVEAHLLGDKLGSGEAIRKQAIVLLSPEPRAVSEKVKLCSRPPCQQSLSLSSSNSAYLRKALHESSQTFVEHALHVARTQFRTQALQPCACYSALYDQRFIDKRMLAINQCDERKQNLLVQKFGLR